MQNKQHLLQRFITNQLLPDQLLRLPELFTAVASLGRQEPYFLVISLKKAEQSLNECCVVKTELIKYNDIIRLNRTHLLGEAKISSLFIFQWL